MKFLVKKRIIVNSIRKKISVKFKDFGTNSKKSL